MGQLGAFFRTEEGDRLSHWCPGCGEMHGVTVTRDPKAGKGWFFNGNIEKPTFKPSVKITGIQTVVDSKGEWTGEWKRDAKGKPLPYCCHYILTDGILNFQPDCTHGLKGQKVPLPALPEWMRD